MCGRFANAQPVPEYRAAVREQLPDRREPTPAPDADDYTPSHNVAPQTRCPVVRRELSWERERRLGSTPNAGPEERGFELVMQTMRWGVVPRFHKHPPSSAEAYRTINARDDTILSPQRSMWHPLLPSQRCVVFVQGFYEWQKRGDADRPERIPHFVGMSEPGSGRADKSGKSKRLMPLAGLWERVRFEGEQKPLYTFTIVTTASNAQLGFLHDRMPVILPTTQAIATWLGLDAEAKSETEVKHGKEVDDSWSPDVARLLRPLQAELECYKVPKEVGKVGNSDPSFILPIEQRKDGLKAFFAKQQQQAESDATRSDRDAGTGEVETAAQSPVREDTEALLAAEEVEQEAAMVEASARAEQEVADRKLAERMQRQLEAERVECADPPIEARSTPTSVVVLDSSDDDVETEEVGDGFQVPEAGRGKRRREPSSRFSPDPFNPPVSPPRPRGGYSRHLSPASGGGIHVTPPRRRKTTTPHQPFPQAPPHPSTSPKRDSTRHNTSPESKRTADIRTFFSPTKPKP